MYRNSDSLNNNHVLHAAKNQDLRLDQDLIWKTTFGCLSLSMSITFALCDFYMLPHLGKPIATDGR